MRWHFHQFGKWITASSTHGPLTMNGRQVGTYLTVLQHRTCSICGLIQTRKTEAHD